MTYAQPEKEKGLVEGRRHGASQVGDFFRQKSAVAAAMYIGYGDWSPRALPSQEVESVWHAGHIPRAVHHQIHISSLWLLLIVRC